MAFSPVRQFQADVIITGGYSEKDLGGSGTASGGTRGSVMIIGRG